MYEPGTLVVILHPLLDRHIPAVIVSNTKTMCEVRYWTTRGLSDVPKRRRQDAILSAAPAGHDPEKLVVFLDWIDDIRTKAKKAAEDQYAVTLKQALDLP